MGNPDPLSRQATLTETQLFASNTELGALICTTDWSTTPFGPIQQWPQSLRTALSLCLHSQFPIVLFWGAELRLLYNDAYMLVLGSKHPAALGSSAQQVFPEIWSIISPLLQGVLHTGQATWAHDLFLPLVRDGVPEERYFTFSYSPILDEQGKVRGVFCPITEATERVLGARRLQELYAGAESARAQITNTLESITDAFYTVDRQWRFTYVNRRAKELWGRPQDDFLIGKNIWEEFPEALRLIFGEQLQKAAAEQLTIDFEGFYPPLSMWMALRVYPSDEGLAVYFQDVTARKEAEAAVWDSEARFRRAFSNNMVAMAVWRTTGELTDANDALLNLIGYTRAELDRGSIRWIDLTPPEYRQYDEQAVAEVDAIGVCTPYEKEYFHKDGRRIPIVIGAGRFDERTGERILFAIDVTERKQAEEALARQTIELQRSNEELQQFAYMTSHDLNAPLRTVTNFLQLLARRYKGKIDATADEYIDVAIGGAQRMQTLLADLLAYARVGGEPLTLAAVNCEIVLTRVLDDLQPSVQESTALITRDPLPTVRGVEPQLGSVFQNLIGNALKFRGPEPPHIHISARQEGSQWVFSVRDNGIGIDSPYVERIFQVFQRLHSRQEYAGSGMGLAICKKIIERHGGRIWVESELGKGATFYFTVAGK